MFMRHSAKISFVARACLHFRGKSLGGDGIMQPKGIVCGRLKAKRDDFTLLHKLDLTCDLSREL